RHDEMTRTEMAPGDDPIHRRGGRRYIDLDTEDGHAGRGWRRLASDCDQVVGHYSVLRHLVAPFVRRAEESCASTAARHFRRGRLSQREGFEVVNSCL